MKIIVKYVFDFNLLMQSLKAKQTIMNILKYDVTYYKKCYE